MSYTDVHKAEIHNDSGKVPNNKGSSEYNYIAQTSVNMVLSMCVNITGVSYPHKIVNQHTVYIVCKLLYSSNANLTKWN